MSDKFVEDHHEEQHQESWDDPQPPVDTFHDSDMGAEGTATVSEESGEHVGYEKEESTEPQDGGQKKSKLIPLIAVVGVLLVLAAVLFWQFGMGSSLTTVTVQAHPLKPPAISDTVPLPTLDAKPKIADTTTAPLSDSSASNNLMSPGAAPSPVSSGGVALPTTNNNASTILPNMDQHMASPPSLDQSAAVAPIQNQSATTNNVPKNTPANNDRLSDLDARLSALSGHVEELQRSLDLASQQLSQVSIELTANQNKTSTNQGIEDRLNQIEQHLAQVEHTPPSLSVPSSLKSDQTSGVRSKLGEEATNARQYSKERLKSRRERVVHSTAMHKHKVVHMASHHPAPELASSSGILAESKSSWVLRAATPNEAWVAKNSTSSELTHVQLGDELPGVGVVQTIRPFGDSWIIEGTEGIVR